MLNRLKLDAVLKKKNPYLFRAKNLFKPADLVSAIMGAYLSSSEEELFGEFLEELAIFVAERTFGGRKSTAPGLDIEMDKGNTRFLVAIKSGTNWGNSSQYSKLEDHFRRAVAVQRQSHRVEHVQAVLGMCYGKSPGFSDMGTYWKVSGQRFWHFLSDDEDLYAEIAEPIAVALRTQSDEFEVGRAGIESRLTAEFIKHFCSEDYAIDWQKLVCLCSCNMPVSEGAAA